MSDVTSRAWRFFRRPKGLLLIVLAVLLVMAVARENMAQAGPAVLGAMLVASLIDVAIVRLRDSKWIIPDGAILSALIVAMILSPVEPWYVATITSGLAVMSKYLFRLRTANVFNPAALALVVTFYPFNTAQSWWGSLPDSGLAGLIALFATGLFIVVRVNKLPAVLAFLGSYFALFTVMSFAGDPAHVAEIFRTPDANAALFFAFFMVSDPPTSPAKPRDQLVFGLITALVAFAVYELVGAAYYLLAGLLVANIWEAWQRRVRRHRRLRLRELSTAHALEV